jgi:hypothetical protein
LSESGSAGKRQGGVAESRGITTYTRSISILPAKSIKVVLTPREPAGAPSITRSATRQPDRTWKAAGLEIRQPGVWTVRVIVATDGGAPIVLDAPIVIDR